VLREGDAEFFAPYVASNSFFAGWTKSESFQRDYVMARAYEFRATLFLVTYRRADRPELLPPRERQRRLREPR